jgi:hypothetical protein
LVRSDFERLSDFFRAQREDEQNGKERLDDNTVNRIILYIDDLDRCPPETVVNMLQAIHLLLAFPIFVVVVAVDSRWVSRSLERCYSWLVPATPSAPMLRTERNDTDWAQAGPGATALDYLEKIFQIPFWLAPMKGPECQRLIRGLTQAASQDQARLAELIARANEQSPTAKHVAATPEEEPATLKAVSDLAQPLLADPLRTPPPLPLTPSLIPPPNAAKVLGSDQDGEADFIDLSPRQLEVEESELQKIEELATLVGRSPRVAKRFLNCYRLLKARMNEDELQKFLADQFRHVTEVLAIIVGVPHLAADVLYVLSKDSVAVDGKALVEQLTKTVGAAALSTGEGAEIVRLLGLASANHLKSLRNVVQLVSRFSFETESKRAGKGPKGPQKKAKAQRFDA